MPIKKVFGLVMLDFCDGIDDNLRFAFTAGKFVFTQAQQTSRKDKLYCGICQNNIEFHVHLLGVRNFYSLTLDDIQFPCTVWVKVFLAV